MVAQFLRLRLRLLGNSFIRRPWQLVGLIIAAVYGLGLAVAAITALIGLRFVDVSLARDIVVVLGSVAVAGFAVLPLLFGVDDAFDPRRFALYGIPKRTLTLGLLVAALVSVPSVVIGIISIAQVVTWTRGVLPVILSLGSAVLITATCVLAARVSTAIASFLLASRRARDAAGLVGVVALVALGPLLTFLAAVDWSRTGRDVLARVADALAWSPLGAAWAAPAEAAAELPGEAFAKFAIALVIALGLFALWRSLVAAMLVTPQREGPVKHYEGLGWFDRFAGSPAGAIAGRSMTYWIRDARYRTSLIVVPIIPILPLVSLAIAGVDFHVLALVPVPIMCLFLAWSTLHNDVAYDNTAVWLHLASNVRGSQDRWGRAAPVFAVGMPLAIAGSLISTWLFGDWQWLPSVLGVNLCLLLAGIGLSSITSARFPYPVTKPGDNPFAQPQSSGTAAALIQSLSFFGLIIATLPVAGIAALAVITGQAWLHVIALVLGIGIGVGVLVGGMVLGARLWDRRAPELLAFTQQN